LFDIYGYSVMTRLKLAINTPFLAASLLLLCQAPLLAQEGEPTDGAATDPAPAAADPAQVETDRAPAADAVSAAAIAEMLEMLKDQQSQLDDQKRQLNTHQQLIATLQGEAEAELAAEKETITKQALQIEEQRKAMTSMQTQIDQINQKK